MQLTASNVRLVAVVLTALCAVSGGIYLVFCKRKDYRRAFAYKGTAGLCFVVLGLLGTDANIRSMLGTGGAAPAGAWLVAAGLIFGLLGDQLLALRFICVNKKTQFFAAGAASFAVGHVLYIIALSHRAPGILLGGLAIGFVALALSGVYNYRKDTNAGNMQVPGMIYMAVVAFMGALAVSVAIHAPGVSTLLFAVGGVLFIISDNILCAYSFGKLSAASARTSAFTRPTTPRSCSSRGAYSSCEYLRWERTELITKSLTRARLRIIEGTHFIANRNPTEFNRAGDEFLETV